MVFPKYDEVHGTSADQYPIDGLLSSSLNLLNDDYEEDVFLAAEPWPAAPEKEMEYDEMPPGTSDGTEYNVEDVKMEHGEWEAEDDGPGEVDAVFTLPVFQNDETALTSKANITSGPSRTVVNDPDLANGITLNIDADGDFDIASAPVVPARQSFDVPALQGTTSKARKSHNLVIDSLLGQANLLSARGNVPDAIKLLHDIVRQEPRRPEAYFQLAHIYENQGLALKSFEHRLLGCNIDRKTSENDWDATGDIAITLGKHEEAAACFKKAAKVAPKQWIYYEKQIRSCEQTGHIARAMKARLVAAQNVDCRAHGFDFGWLVSMIKAVVDYYTDNYDENKCINALVVHIQRCVEFHIDASEQHEILVTQLLRREEYSRAAESIVAICPGFKGLDRQGYPGWVITEKSTVSPWPPVRIAMIEVSPSFPSLMLCRLVLCFSRMKQVRLASLVYEEMFCRGFDVNTAGLYADVARVFLELEEYEHGERFTSNLLRYTNFVNDAELYYLHGLFNDKLNNLDIAEVQYRHAIVLDPNHVNARVCLSQLLQNRNDTTGALEILADANLDICSQYPDQRILLRQASLLENTNPEAYIRCLRLLLAPHFHLVLRRQQQTMIVKRHRNCINLPTGLKKILFTIVRGAAFTKMVEDMGQSVLEDNRELILKTAGVYDYTMMLVERLLGESRMEEAMQVLAYASLYPFLDEQTTRNLTNYLFTVSLHAKHYVLAFECVRFLLADADSKLASGKIDETTFNIRRQRLFLALGFIAVQQQNSSMQRYIDRLYTKNLDNLQLKMLVANNALVSGSYKTAIYLYNQVDQTYPNTLAKLSLGVAFIGLACKKTSSDRIPLGVRALAKFTEYMHAREAEGLAQEAYYNIGRMFHGLGFFTQAVYWYERCLKTPDPVVYRNGVPLPGDTYSMKPLAALNYIDTGMRNPPGEINSGDIPGDFPGDMRGISPGTNFWVFLVLNVTVSYY